jgi:hypothetical protein
MAAAGETAAYAIGLRERQRRLRERARAGCGRERRLGYGSGMQEREEGVNGPVGFRPKQKSSV